MNNESFKYYAFISYSHKDKKIAQKLQRRLEKYHLPTSLRKSNPALPKNLRPVFIDESNLVARGTLKDSLQANLDASNYIILISSPSSARSEYVNDEIEYFINKGKADHIIPLIVEGVPHSGDPLTECFPNAILALPREQEILGIDIRVFGLRDAFLRVIAALLRLDLDNFISREARARKKKACIFAFMLMLLMIITVMLIPPSYDEFYAENIMTYTVSAYTNSGHQYEYIRSLVDCAIQEPERFAVQLMKYKEQILFIPISEENSSLYLQDLSEMMKTGKVMPWSRKPMSQRECEELLTLAENRNDDYSLYVSALEFFMRDDYAHQYYSKYPEMLSELIEIDADITAELYQIVCKPHIEKYAESSTMAQMLEAFVSNVPKQSEHFTGEDVRQSKESLLRLRGTRDECLMKINSYGIFEAYKSSQEYR